VRFRVFLHAKNALIQTNGYPKRLGFFTTRIVDAPNKKDAELLAIKLLESDSWLAESLLNTATDPFTLEAEEVEPARPGEQEMPGFSWYPMTADN
jgi:hypothetical protein